MDGSLARNIDFEVANFRGSHENSWENVDFEATKCQNWRRSRTKCLFWCSNVSRLESLVFPWLRRVYGGSRKTSPFRRLPSRLSCRFAWHAWHFVTFQHVLYRVESVKIGGRLARNARFAAPTWLVLGHSLAGVALCDSPTCFIPCRKCQNWRKSRTKCSFCCSQLSRLESLVFLWHRRVYGGSLAPHSTLLTPHFTLHTPHFNTPHSTIYTLDPSLLTLHFTLYTLHSTLYTLHFTLRTLHSPLHTLQPERW